MLVIEPESAFHEILAAKQSMSSRCSPLRTFKFTIAYDAIDAEGQVVAVFEKTLGGPLEKLDEVALHAYDTYIGESALVSWIYGCI